MLATAFYCVIGCITEVYFSFYYLKIHCICLHCMMLFCPGEGDVLQQTYSKMVPQFREAKV